MNRLKRLIRRRPYRVTDHNERQDRLINRVFPYSLLLSLQHFFLPRRWVQRLFYPRRVRLVRELASAIPGADIHAAVLGSLVANTGQRWRRNVFLDDSYGRDWVKMEGLELLEKASKASRGVIIVFNHAIEIHVFAALLGRRIPVEIFGIRGVNREVDREHVSTAFAFQLVAAFKNLQSGGIVVIAGDGLAGQPYLELPFMGHSFPFRSGFAEMATHSGAALMALSIKLDLDGRLTFELVEIPQPDSGSKEARVDAIVRNYAVFLQQRQLQFLSALQWPKLEQISRMPRLPEGTPASSHLPGSTG